MIVVELISFIIMISMFSAFLIISLVMVIVGVLEHDIIMIGGGIGFILLFVAVIFVTIEVFFNLGMFDWLLIEL